MGAEHLACNGFAGLRLSTNDDGGTVMSEERPMYDDEIDLFELFETLWDGKWLISVFVVLATSVGFGYSNAAKPANPVYIVSIPYTLNAYISGAQRTNLDTRLLAVLGSGWEKHGNAAQLSVSTTAPLSTSEYETQIERASVSLTKELVADTTAEIVEIETQMRDALLRTESVATRLLAGKSLLRDLDSGQDALSFGSVSVEESPSKAKTPQILAFSAIFGGMLGVFVVLIRNAIKKRKEQLANA